MTIWLVCSLVALATVDPCMGPPMPSYETEHQCIDGETAAFIRLGLPDPFRGEHPILRCESRLQAGS
jgi:hypothetical protein